MFSYEIFNGSLWGVSAMAKYESGFHWQEIDHADVGENLNPDGVFIAVDQIIDHVNESEELITPFDVGEPFGVTVNDDHVTLEWRGVLDGLNDRGESDNLVLYIEVGKCDTPDTMIDDDM